MLWSSQIFRAVLVHQHSCFHVLHNHFCLHLYWHNTTKSSRWHHISAVFVIQCVPLATKPGISLIILTPRKILQRNLNRSTFVVWEMKRNVSVVCVCSAPNCCDMEQQSASQPGSIASGTPYITNEYCDWVWLSGNHWLLNGIYIQHNTETYIVQSCWYNMRN